MNNSELEFEKCPINEPNCKWLVELVSVRQNNEELKLLVTTDQLTGLNNFRYFQQKLNTEMEQTIRTGRPTCLVMIDLDFFKAVNDDRGHEAGNEALKTAAAVFQKALRQADVVCRYGGEEFAIILPQTSLPTAVKVAERVCKSLSQTPIFFEHDSFHVTGSFGVNVYLESDEYTLESFVDTVDQYMYQAKESGRNRVCHPDFSTIKTETSVSAEEKSALFGK